MQPFIYSRLSTIEDAARNSSATKKGEPRILAGGTTLIDLMKLNVEHPNSVMDINEALSNSIEKTPQGLRIGAGVRMESAAHDKNIVGEHPVIAQSLSLAASAQIRNMASLGGNVLQRTRCPYFRDVAVHACNKRKPGSGCAAIGGIDRVHAVLGAADNCIATYGGDFAQSLLVSNASVEIQGRGGPRMISFSDLHVLPAENPAIETTLEPGEIITAFLVPNEPWSRRSLYLKIRDRESYAYALASAAIVLDLDGDRVRSARIAVGGVATVPWRSREAETFLEGKVLDEATAKAAGEAAFKAAQARGHNAYKIKLGAETIARALMQAKALEI